MGVECTALVVGPVDWPLDEKGCTAQQLHFWSQPVRGNYAALVLALLKLCTICSVSYSEAI